MKIEINTDALEIAIGEEAFGDALGDIIMTLIEEGHCEEASDGRAIVEKLISEEYMNSLDLLRCKAKYRAEPLDGKIIEIDDEAESLEAQAAELCHDEIVDTITKPMSFIGPDRYYAQIFELKTGRFLIVSMNDTHAAYTVVKDLPTYEYSADEEDRYNAMCDAVGITRPGDIASEVAEMEGGWA